MITQAIIKAMGEGDAKAYRQVYDHYFTAVGTWAAKFIHSTIGLQDVVQEVFTHLWTRRATFAAADDFSAYLYKATKNECLKYIAATRQSDDMPDLPSPYSEVDAEQKAAITHIETAIGSLSGKIKAVIELTTKGWDVQEIGEKLKLKPQSVYNMTYLGIKELKRKLYSPERRIVIVKPEIPVVIKAIIPPPTPIPIPIPMLIPVESILSSEVQQAYFTVLFARDWYLNGGIHKKKSTKPMTRTFWIESKDKTAVSWRFPYLPGDEGSIQYAARSASRWMNRALDKLLMQKPYPIMRLKR